MIRELPPVYVIEPTSRCNMRCVMCPQEQQQKIGDMSVKLLEAIVPQISSHAKFIQLYFVGEPTIHPALNQMIRLLKTILDVKIEISTNLIQLRKRANAEEFLMSGVDRVLCCIEGATAETHSALRTSGRFDSAVETVMQLARIKAKYALPVELIVKCIETVHNRHELTQFMTYWNQVPGVTPKISWMNTWGGSMLNLVAIGPRGCPNGSAKRIPCAELWNKLVIRWDGTVVLCCHDWASQVMIGDATQESLLSIWNSSAMEGIRRSHTQAIFPGICAPCREWSKPDEFASDYGIEAGRIITPTLQE